MEAVQERLIWLVEIAVAVKLAGAEAGVVSGGGPGVPELQPDIPRTRNIDRKTAQENSGRTRFPRSRFTWIPSG